VDLTRIDGVDVMVAQTLVSEVGLDMSRWKTEARFASWLGLCPDNRISGYRVLSRGTRQVANRAASALRLGASTRLKSQTYLGAQYRRLRSKLGAPKAIIAMAHRHARNSAYKSHPPTLKAINQDVSEESRNRTTEPKIFRSTHQNQLPQGDAAGLGPAVLPRTHRA
jgi:hypothetical protein